MLVSASSFRARSFVRSQFAVGFIVLVLQCFPLHLDLRFEYILLPLPQATGSQMSLQKKEKGKQYLYVQQAGKQGLMIVDVSRPEEPCLLNRTAEANQATTGNLAIVSPDVAIAEAPEKTPSTLTSSSHPTETVRVLDLSDPRNPKTLETFNKVTSLLPDGGHGLIYLTNNHGLWILRYDHPSRFEPAKKKPPSDSEAERFKPCPRIASKNPA
jgi:hypothetical protein